jgi:hypothetical protein
VKSKKVLVCSVTALVCAVAAGATVATIQSAGKSAQVSPVSAAGLRRALLLPTPMPTPTPPAPSVPALAQLKPLELSDMQLWNWNGKWLASEWNSDGPIPWRYDHINQVTGKDTMFTLDAAGAPQLQALNGTPAYSRGLWETEVTLPRMREGMVVAPLWIYDTASKDEVDFEFAGTKGLDVSMHTYVNGAHQQNTVRLFAGTDMSGKRKRFGIKVDEAAGYVEMYVDGVLVHRWDRSKMTSFVSKPLKPWIQIWPTDPNNAGYVYWVGKWGGLSANEKLTMTVHGYGYTAIP